MKIKVFTAIIISRLMTLLLRFLGRGGTSFPGKAALAIDGNLLKKLSKEVKIVLITGTNGKTTTSRIIAEILRKAGYSFFENKSGANLISGITASFASHFTLTGRPKFDYAVIECDEAAFKTVCPILSPETIVITNLFRDQLDRYGEITHTKAGIVSGITGAPGALVVLNADDSLSYSIKDEIPNETFLYGIDSPPYGSDDNFLSDAPYCIRCKTEYQYDYRTYAHLGGFRCPSCGYSRQQPDLSADEISLSLDSSDIVLQYKNNKKHAVIALPGAYNIYNSLAAASAALCMGIDISYISNSLGTFKSGFGRMEKFDLDGTEAHMILVKNPAGLNQVLNFLSSDSHPKVLVLILNDRHADGTDISWIWDVNYEKLVEFIDSISGIVVSGTRAEELMTRLKYAGLDTSMVTVNKNFNEIITDITGNYGNDPVYILPTYTAMFDFRKALSRRYNLRKFWE